MTTLAISNSTGFGMRGSHPNGDYTLPGQVFVSSTDVPPESFLYGRTIEVGDTITYTTTTSRDAGGSGVVTIDSLGVPSIDGQYGMYDISATWTNQTSGIPIVLFGITPHSDAAAIEAIFNYYPLNAEGYSIITPSADSRLVYVSETGDDGTAQDYTLATLPNVNDWEDPGAVNAYQTIDAAKARLRSGYADWMLLKRSEVFTLVNHFQPPTGRSVTERTVVTSYGTGARPHINPPLDRSLRIWGSVQNIAVVSIKLLPTYRDPDHADFAGWGNTFGGDLIRFYDTAGLIQGILIENCWLEYGAKGLKVGGCDNGDVIIRRNIVTNSYSEDAHSQGIFASDSFCIEENFFYHCGWYKQSVLGDNAKEEGQATIFNHSVYMASHFNSIYRNNISIMPSSIHMKNTSDSSVTNTIRSYDVIGNGNLMIDGEVGISLGGNTDFDDGPRFRDIRLFSNVLTKAGQSHQTNRTLGWGDDIQDWQGGFYGDNLQFDCNNESVSNLYSYKILGDCSDVAITRNTSVNIGRPISTGGSIGNFGAQSGTMSNVLHAYNIGCNPDCFGQIVEDHDVIPGITHRDNKYFSLLTESQWFEYDGVDMGKAAWDSATGDTGSTVTETLFVDDARRITTYMASLGQTATLDEFIAKCKQQDKGSWDDNYSARYVNAYFRSGFREA